MKGKDGDNILFSTSVEVLVGVKQDSLELLQIKPNGMTRIYPNIMLSRAPLQH